MQEYQYTYSFIIPHHNSPELLNRCLDSIPQREDIQIIVVDDNSAEDKRPRIKRNDVEVIYIDAEHTKGAGRARNYGLKAAKGKWLLFADCDDYYNEGFLDVLDKYKDEDIEALYFNYDYKDGKTGINKTKMKIQTVIENCSNTKEDLLFVKFRSKAPWNKMISSYFIRKYDLYFEEVPNGNDILFSMFIACLANSVFVINQSIYTYLYNEGSIITQNPTVDATMCRITHDIKMVQVYKTYCPQYVHSVLLNILRKIKTISKYRKLLLIVSLLCNCIYLYKCRNEWVNIIESRRWT